MPEAQQNEGRKDRPKLRTGSPTLQPNSIRIPKNRSTGNLTRDLTFTPLDASRHDSAEEAAPNPRLRFSMDGSTLSGREALMLSPLMSEQEHGFGISGLRRIRQGPSSRAPSRAPSGTLSRTATAPPSPETRFEPILSRASSMNLHVHTGRGFSMDTGGTAMVGLGEDLHKFSLESLHSFSFAHQSEDALHNRSNVLKKSIDFMRDRPGFANSMQHPGLMMAQAKVNGDEELQDILALLSKANLLEGNRTSRFGAVTGPVMTDGENVFEKTFAQRSESPEALDTIIAPSPKTHIVPTFVTPPPADNDSSANQVPSAASDRAGKFGSEKNESGSIEKQESERIETGKNETQKHISGPYEQKSSLRNTIHSRPGFKRTVTDTRTLSLQTQISDVLARPYNAHDSALDSALLSPTMIPPFVRSSLPPTTPGGTNHAAARLTPASQAIFSTSTSEPWTILSANDLACLMFGVTKGEIRKLGIMEMIRSSRREWLKARLEAPGSEAVLKARNSANARSRNPSAATSSGLGISRGGITAMLLSKPPARQQANKRSQTENPASRTASRRGSASEKSRGVLLCGDIVSIQKRNGATGSASVWVKEKPGYLIWVLEEIVEDSAEITLDESGKVLSATGAVSTIWGSRSIEQGAHIQRLLPKLAMTGPSRKTVDYRTLESPREYIAKTNLGFGVPVTVTANPLLGEIRVSSYPNMAGIVVISADDMRITSSNAVFTRTLFGYSKPEGMHITDIIPQFVKLVDEFTDEGHECLADGAVIPEQSFRRARAHLAFREDGTHAAEALFLKPTGLPARHADGSEIFVDVQMRVVNSDTNIPEEAIIEERDDEELHERIEVGPPGQSQLVYALWITYSRHLHSIGGGSKTPLVSRPGTPPRQPSPGQAVAIVDPLDSSLPTTEFDTLSELKLEQVDEKLAKGHKPSQSQIERDIKEATSEPISLLNKSVIEIKPEPVPDSQPSSPEIKATPLPEKRPGKKWTIDDFVILEDMGQGAYGQVKLARYKEHPGHKVVLKYVTKKRILVDTWMRDRKLGTVPSEIHVLNFLKKEGMRHPNIVEMIDFFEDKDYYYIMMVPHGLPGMDLFDYIEVRQSMTEAEVRHIFVQVADAIRHLHEDASVVHRDIKDENIILDGENNVKLIDFGSAAYTRNGPFDVFVGTIDYAAPEVITGQSYKGKPQDIWALGILLYTLVYKENPFYNVDEILERDLRVPHIMSEDSIDLIRAMLNRDVEERYTIQQVLDHPWTKGGRDDGGGDMEET